MLAASWPGTLEGLRTDAGVKPNLVDLVVNLI